MSFKGTPLQQVLLLFATWIFALLTGCRVEAHCDGLDGPVVTSGRQALERVDVNLVLPWVQEKDEAEIRHAFAQTLIVRKLSPEAKDLADQAFFETLVRIHRAGEGEPYTGLKPVGRDLGPAIPAADKAIEEGSLDKVLGLLKREGEEGLRSRFEEVLETKDFMQDDVQAGRRYVQAYVDFVHYVENLHEAAEGQLIRDHPETEIGEEQGEGHSHSAHHEEKGGHTMGIQIPAPLKSEHQELHAKLAKAARTEGAIGEAASRVAKIMHPHFVKEEEYALPPLGLLKELTEGKVPVEADEVIRMTDRLKADLPEMLNEHKEIIGALEDLSQAAKKEGKQEYADFAEKLILHAKTEEEVMYPAALLVGDFLKMKRGG